MKKALIVGSLNMDMTAEVENLPRLGETILGKSLYESCGGKGANQAAVMSRLGMRTEMIGMVGNDEAGEKLISSLKDYNVETRNIIRENGVTGRAFIMVDNKGDNSIIVIPGNNFMLKEKHIDDKIEVINGSDVVILQNEIPFATVEYVLEKSKEAGKTTIFNPAPATPLTDRVYRNTDYLILNETEMEEIFSISADSTNYTERLASQKKLLGIRNIVLTLGSSGSILFDEEDSIVKYNAYKVDTVDTTAAGDSFIGAFVLKLCEKGDRDAAMKYATAVSAIVVTRKGAQDSIPGREEIEDFIKNTEIPV